MEVQGVSLHSITKAMVSEELYLTETETGAHPRDSVNTAELSGYVPRAGTRGRGAEDCHL